uniref:Serine/threonine-protein phosphatase n=1 Tax=Romanomermis culicivorax TaxID=13658 RepID=A0A915IXW3_ROMCU
MDESDYLESLIEKLMQFTGNTNDQRLILDEKELLYVIAKMEIYYRSKGALVEAAAPVTIVGDIHGQFRDLKRIIKHSGMPPDTRYVFLGDYVDRGPFGIETVSLIFLFKLRYPGDIFVLRGNHETASTNAVYGFFEKAFDSLPLCCIIAGKLFAVHGGLSPELNRIDQIRRLTLPISVPESDCLTSDLLWSDPHPYVKGFARNNRGISFVFGADIVETFCRTNGLDMIVRGHQVFPQGYEFFANKKLVTVFSAPAYHEEFDNTAALLNVSTSLSCSLREYD